MLLPLLSFVGSLWILRSTSSLTLRITACNNILGLLALVWLGFSQELRYVHLSLKPYRHVPDVLDSCWWMALLCASIVAGCCGIQVSETLPLVSLWHVICLEAVITFLPLAVLEYVSEPMDDTDVPESHWLRLECESMYVWMIGLQLLAAIIILVVRTLIACGITFV